MSKHTPGPWRVATNRHPSLDGKPWGWVASPGEHANHPAGTNLTWEGDTGKANARLIAAAPELLEALRTLATLVEPCGPCDGTGQDPRHKRPEACKSCGGVGEILSPGAGGEIGTIRAAIAKAEGK